MTTLHQRNQTKPGMKLTVESDGAERREHRRHDMELCGISVDRWDGNKRSAKNFGRLVDQVRSIRFIFLASKLFYNKQLHGSLPC